MITYEPHSNQQPVDVIVHLLNEGHPADVVFAYMLEYCSLSLVTKKQQKAMRDLISQISSRNVFATGEQS
jgi:hypothetical protein